VLLDAGARHDLTVITGSPAKLWIAGLSIGYDLIFVAQHYWLYPDAPAAAGGAGEKQGAAGAAGAAPAPSGGRAVAPAPRGGGAAAGREQQPAAVLAFTELGRRWGRKQP
jgi:cystinosin